MRKGEQVFGAEGTKWRRKAVKTPTPTTGDLAWASNGRRRERLRQRADPTGRNQRRQECASLQYNWHALMLQGDQGSRKPTGITSEHGHSLHRLRHKLYLLSGDALDCYETTKKICRTEYEAGTRSKEDIRPMMMRNIRQTFL